MPKTLRVAPSELTDTWPMTPSWDVAGEKARLLALNLRSALGTASIRSIADKAGLDERTLRNILSGAKWPDLRTIALLEAALGVGLWPASSDGGGTS